MSDFEKSLKKLNHDQREAVDHIDGPLIVVAGPGTGKTQLLSLRAANILHKRDIAPENLLCLTYTDAGAQAMRKRLIELIGKDAYGIEVSTFHSFASSIKSRFPQYFPSKIGAGVISELYSTEIIDSMLKALPVANPLFSSGNVVKSYYVGPIKSFISNLKRTGLTPDEYSAIMKQNLECANYLCNETELPGILSLRASKKVVQEFEDCLYSAYVNAPSKLKKRLIDAPGVYEPYISWLYDYVNNTELMDAEGKRCTGYSKLKGNIYKSRELSVIADSKKGLAAAEIYANYQDRLNQENLIDYDDMIMDCILTLKSNEELRLILQEQYKYIQIDEFQDTNGAQMRIVNMLCECVDNPNVMAVGDDDQAIMRFQGASVQCINQFKHAYNPKEIVLKTNYRSTPEVVNLGMNIANQIEYRLIEGEHKVISAHRSSGEQLTYTEHLFENPELQYLAMVQDIRRRIDEGFIKNCKDEDEAIAVLASKHKSLNALIPYLRKENIPFAYKETSELFSMESMQTMLAIIRFVSAYASGSLSLAESFLPQIVASPELGGKDASSVEFALLVKRKYKKSWISAMKDSKNWRIADIYNKLVDWSTRAISCPVRELIYDISKECKSYYESKTEENPLELAEFEGGIAALIKFATDEVSSVRKQGGAMRLPEVVERLDRAYAFGIKIDASIKLGKPGAVRLITAHGSKGLEFDLVYILDAEDKMWHDAKKTSNLYPSNMLIGDKKDEDDARRLLFVAVTRAKSYLELYRSGGNMLNELQEGLIESEEPNINATDLERAIETGWRNSYALDTPELQELLQQNLPPKALSASSLNTFVKYEEENLNNMEYATKYIMSIPNEPSISLEFGNIVHSFLENYINCTYNKQDSDVTTLSSKFKEQVRCMDFKDEDIAPFLSRFDHIVTYALPWIQMHIADNLRLVTEAAVNALVGDDVPLFGKCDLLLIDDENKIIHVVDYKTGFKYPNKKPDAAYQRQLQFYRLLLENSYDYAEYHVETCENWYVEPEKGKDTMHDAVISSISDDDIDELTVLINAVWHRIIEGKIDVSGFETSEIKSVAISDYEAMPGRKTIVGRAEALQKAFETWLIEQDEA